MMQAEYKREDHKSYFVIQDSRLNDAGENASYDLEMLSENKLNGLLPISVHSFNGQTELYYDISGKQTLRVLYEKRELQKEELKLLFQGMEQAIFALENYLLDMERLIIDPDYIYYDAARQEIYLLYYPFSEEVFEESVIRFSDYILDRICNEDEQTVMYAYNFYRLVKEENGDLAAALKKLREENGDISKEQPSDTDCFEEESFYLDDAVLEDFSINTDACEESEKSNKKGKKRLSILISGCLFLIGIGIMAYSSWRYESDFSDLFTRTEAIVGFVAALASIAGFIIFTVAESAINRKRLMRTESKVSPDLGQSKVSTGELNSLRDIEDYAPEFFGLDKDLSEDGCLKTQEKSSENMFETVLIQENCYTEQRILKGKIRGKSKQIDLAVFPFIVGKSRDQVDFVIEDSSVSRIHARFTLRDDIVFLTDLNSTNGTMKNGIRLQPNELVALESGDEIRFGKVIFTYY